MNVSIAMSTYNGAKYLDTQLQSFARQTQLPCELVIGDDGSTDHTIEIVRRFSRSAPFPVRLTVNPARLGYIKNFISTVARCSGQFVAFSDQDDVWLPEKLATCVSAFSQPDVMLTMHSASVVDAELASLGCRLPNINRNIICSRLRVNPWDASPGFALVFRRRITQLAEFHDVPNDHMGPDEPMGHDHWVFMLASAFGSIAMLKDTLALYRRHATNTTSPVERGLRRFVRLARFTGSQHYASLASIAMQRAAFFRRIASNIEPSLVGACSEAAHYYDHLSETLKLRTKLHDSSTGCLARVGSFLSLMARGDYRTAMKGGLGGRAIVKDLCRCVVPIV